MAYCIHCGKTLQEGANFCTKCGAEIKSDVVEPAAETDEDLDEADEPDVEDCDESPEKGAPADCYATFDDREVIIYREDGAIYRRIRLNYDVLDAVVAGDRVAITCEGGWHYLYTVDGTLVRTGRH